MRRTSWAAVAATFLALVALGCALDAAVEDTARFTPLVIALSAAAIVAAIFAAVERM